MVVIFLSTPLYAESNTPNVGDIADYGVWATENNKQLFINNIYSDIDTFYTPIVDNYVPVEARVGKSLIGALKIIGDVL
ncbi:MAG: hypothetical protein GX944_02605, partial [Alphaproteobacteria bacterium]|nr:hypothetical protein [Alphaproteobacteria bacterium]